MSAGRILRISAGLVVTLPVLIAAQAPIFHTATRLVVLAVTVTNAHGEVVTNLDESAFSLYENGKRQPISIFRRDDIPVSIGLLIDNSGSMRPLRSKVEAAALAFARASNPQDEMFVVNFADKPRIDVAMTHDVGTLEAGIARTDAIGGTALRDSVDAAQRYLRDHATRDRRLLLVITDGYDNASLTSLDQIRGRAERADTVVDAIGLFGSDARAKKGQRELEELTRATGGAAYFPAGIEQVEALAVDLARQIRHQYTIAYAPLNQAMDGSYRSIRVEIGGRRDLTAHTRPGYRALGEAVR